MDIWLVRNWSSFERCTWEIACWKELPEGGEMMYLDIMEFLEQCLGKPILGIDKRYGPFLKSKGVK